MTHDNADARTQTGAGTPAFRQVSCYETFTYATRIAAQHGIELDLGRLPIAGTLQWCGMPDDDARKLLSLLLGGVREALANEMHQDAVEQAGRDIWAGEDWSAVARQVQRRREIDEMRKTA